MQFEDIGMATITAALVAELRAKSGAGMMDCKKALEANDGDIETSADWLRKKGLAAAAKKAGRVAADGLVGVAVKGNAGAVVEVNAETDFVARNENFQNFAKTVAGLALDVKGDIAALEALAYPGGEGRSVKEQLAQLISTIGENMELRRTAFVGVDKGIVANYIHNSISDGLGKIGVLVGLQSEADAAQLQALGKQLAMHVAATNPLSLNIEALDPEVTARERDIMLSKAEASGKPKDIIEKMVDGQMRKFYQETVLLEQISVLDGETKISKLIEQAAKTAGKPITLTAYVCYKLGEGKEKKEEDFAAEVAAAMGN
jgi:elongation factor Ts